MKKFLILLTIFPGMLMGILPVYADEFSSSSFRIVDPGIVPGGYFSSSNYQVNSSITQISSATSSSSSFSSKPGHNAYPSVGTPAVSATAGNEQVVLSWTSVTGTGGWTVSGYNIGQSTTSGGPYAYTSLGNVTSLTRTGLSNGTAYYFVIRPQDTFGNSIATSSEVSSTPASLVAATPTPIPASVSTAGQSGGSQGTVPLFIQTQTLTPVISLPIQDPIKSAEAKLIDIQKDGIVNILDFNAMMVNWDSTQNLAAAGSAFNSADMNKNGIVDIIDFNMLMVYWGVTY